MVLLKASGGDRYEHMCASAQGCQKVVSGPWSWSYRRTKASQQDAENIILVLWKNSKYSSTLSHLSSQTKLLRQNFSHFNGNREAIILVNMKMDLQSTLILWLFNMFFREVKV